jgi:zinc/manganese transport system substrate-binding protein
VPVDRRVLVTNHDALGYFADRYGFEVVGTVIPGISTQAAADAADFAALATTVRDRGVPAIFAETTSSTALADALAAEVGRDVAVVTLYTGSLGPPDSGADTYVGMLETDAHRIADALAP